MKKLTILFICVLLLTACGAQVNEMDKDMIYKRITAQDAKNMMDNEDVIVLDVRTQEEYDEGHIKDALLIPDTELANYAEELLPDKEAKILVYCRSGRRSALSCDVLAELGYKNVYDFGGILDWKYELAN